MATDVAAPRDEVWRRLVDPDEVARWSPGACAPARAEEAWPEPGARLRLSTRVRALPVALEQRVLELTPGRRLRCDVRLGLVRFEAAFTLTSGVRGRGTRLALRVVTGSEAPLVGGALDRFAVRRLASELAASWLAALREHCEAGPVAAGACPRAAPA